MVFAARLLRACVSLVDLHLLLPVIPITISDDAKEDCLGPAHLLLVPAADAQRSERGRARGPRGMEAISKLQVLCCVRVGSSWRASMQAHQSMGSGALRRSSCCVALILGACCEAREPDMIGIFTPSCSQSRHFPSDPPLFLELSFVSFELMIFPRLVISRNFS